MTGEGKTDFQILRAEARPDESCGFLAKSDVSDFVFSLVAMAGPLCLIGPLAATRMQTDAS